MLDIIKDKIEFIAYLNKEADFKPMCHRCHYANHVWSINDEWICKDCLTKEESRKIITYVENILKN